MTLFRVNLAQASLTLAQSLSPQCTAVWHVMSCQFSGYMMRYIYIYICISKNFFVTSFSFPFSKLSTVGLALDLVD